MNVGLEPPNYTQIPNTILHVMPEMKEAELRLILAICRQTFGFHRERDSLSLTQLMVLTGLSRQGVVNAMGQPYARRYVRREKVGNSYSYGLKVVNEVDHPLAQVVNEVDHSLAQVVNDVDRGSQRGLPEIVNEVDPQKKRQKKAFKTKQQARARGEDGDDECARASSWPAVDGCGSAGTTSDAKSVGELLPAAAASLEEEGEEGKALVVALTNRGVDEVVAERLVAGHDPEHVRAMLERGETEAEGPGWYVRAIEDGYRPGSGGDHRRRFTHAEALAYLERQGITLDQQNPLTRYFDVRKEDGQTYFILKEQQAA